MTWNSEKVVKPVFGGLAFASLVFLLGIILILFQQGLPIFRIVNLFEFIGGKAWYPTAEPAEFGILPLILGTLWITLGAMLFCIPVGIGSALFLHEIAGFRLRSILKPIIEILAGIPSIVYGFFGMVIIAPFLQNLLDIPIGQCALTASLILGVMAVPTVCSLAEDALNFVPKSFREASYALGACLLYTS